MGVLALGRRARRDAPDHGPPRAGHQPGRAQPGRPAVAPTVGPLLTVGDQPDRCTAAPPDGPDFGSWDKMGT